MESPLTTPTEPDYRLTVAHRQLMVLDWMPYMPPAGGPMSEIVRRRAADGVLIANLYVIENDDSPELIVEPVSQLTVGASQRRLLLRWAQVCGYRRVWLTDRLIELD